MNESAVQNSTKRWPKNVWTTGKKIFDTIANPERRKLTTVISCCCAAGLYILPFVHSTVWTFYRLYILPFVHSTVCTFYRLYFPPFVHSTVWTFCRLYILPFVHSTVYQIRARTHAGAASWLNSYTVQTLWYRQWMVQPIDISSAAAVIFSKISSNCNQESSFGALRLYVWLLKIQFCSRLSLFTRLKNAPLDFAVYGQLELYFEQENCTF